MMSFPMYEEIVYGRPVVIAKVTMAECLHNLHVNYLLHAYTFDGLEYVCMRCVFDSYLCTFGPFTKSQIDFVRGNYGHFGRSSQLERIV